MRTLACVILTIAACAGCPNAPPSAPMDASDAGDVSLVDELGNASACARACTNLSALGCPEGATRDGGLSCATLCARVQSARLTDLKPTCIANAKNVAAVRACGSVRCANPIAAEHK